MCNFGQSEWVKTPTAQIAEQEEVVVSMYYCGLSYPAM